MMQGNIWAIPFSNSRYNLTPISELGESLDNLHHHRASTPHFKGLRVLLADDDVVIRAVTRKLLEKLGCNVTSVSLGIQCISSLSAFGTAPFQLVVLDRHINKMGGFEAAMKIRKLRSGSCLAIVALTASAEDGVEKCLLSGINGLIRKTVVLQALRDELYRVLHIA